MNLTTITKKLEDVVDINNIVETISSHTVDTDKLGKIAKAAALTYTTYIISTKLYDAFFGPLSGLPGPIGFRFYGFQYSRSIGRKPGDMWECLKVWREKYGRVIRLGPNRIGISDKRMLRQIQVNDADFCKGPMYVSLQRRSPPTVFNLINRVEHKQRRRIISPAFSIKYINSLESFMQSTTNALVNRVDKDIKKTLDEQTGYGKVDIWLLVQYLALDVIGETAFGKTFNMLEKEDHLVSRAVNMQMERSFKLLTNPILGPLLMKLPNNGILKANEELKEFMKQIIIERLEGGEAVRRNDILQILIDSQRDNDPEQRLTAQMIAQETVLFLTAGSETTANTTGFVFVELMKHPEKLALLRQELDAVPFENDQKLLNHEQLKTLPYLNAVINETLRLDSIIVNGFERVPLKDTVLDGHFIPKGTILHINNYHAHIDNDYWPEAEKWIPERWIAGSGYPEADTEAFFPFSAGARNCIGQGFAYQEMRLCIANVIKLYDMEAISEEVIASDDRRSFITLGVRSGSYNIKMKRRTVTA
ncbi:cytochrome P450 [Phascolomyces articulosus]|uniref:Cytochrome P450 n=1 Tax=Phascolomyces articulosus TaxID=60185 RepID=A0AAD5PJ81_9FUNG|nr:cytochrome P450 [Phascolomyces articulosus]